MNTSPQKNPKKQKLSRQEKLKRNPVPWIVTSVIALVLLFPLIPKLQEWNTMKTNISKNETDITNLQGQVENLKTEKNQVFADFEEKSKDARLIEEQIYPSVIDTGKIAKVLEIYSLIVANLLIENGEYTTSHFDLQKLNFGNTTQVKGKPYFQTSLSVDFESDKRNIDEFIRFIQKGELPNVRIAEALENKYIENFDVQYLESSLLPLMQIDSIKQTKQKSRDSDEPDKFSVKMSIQIFSSPPRR